MMRPKRWIRPKARVLASVELTEQDLERVQVPTTVDHVAEAIQYELEQWLAAGRPDNTWLPAARAAATLRIRGLLR